MSSTTYDAVIVGSGASGSFAAKELTAQGLSVLLLEAGREVTAKDFELPAKPKKVRSINIMERAIATLSGQAVQARALFFRTRQSKFYVNDRDHPYTTPKDAPFVWVRSRQSGGRMHTFGRMLMRWSDDDFKARTRTGRGVDWPISYADLQPFYDEVESYLGLYGNNDNVESLPDGKYKAPSKLSPAEQKFKETVERRWPGRHVVGWRFIAPEPSRTMRAIRDARDSDRLTIRYNAIVRRVLSKGNRATGVEVIDALTGAVSTVTAQHVVICASPIESVRLLLNSASADHPDGLGNSSGTLGRYFMDQVPLLATGRFPQPDSKWEGDDSQPTDPFYAQIGGIFIPRSSEQRAPNMRGDFGFQGVIGRGSVPAGEPVSFMGLGFGQMLPHADNRISLDPRKRDRWGIPAPHIRCKMHPEEHELLSEQEASLLETVNGAGGQIELLGSPHGMREWGRGGYPDADPISRFLFRRFFKRVMVMGSSIHESGGARMGDDPKQSVLNKWGQCWDAPNVYVTDASAFASAGISGTTLTIMAQTVRACRHLAQSR